jgi:dTDP-4-amino-4,6-dideoxygalactose transaminase
LHSARNLPVAQRISEAVICLPLYPELEYDKVAFICDTIRNPESISQSLALAAV